MESKGTTRRELWRRPGLWLVGGPLLAAIAIVMEQANHAEYWTQGRSGSITSFRIGVGLAVYFTLLLIGTMLVRNAWRSWPGTWPRRLWLVCFSAAMATTSFSGLLQAKPDFYAECSLGAGLVWILILSLIFLVAVSNSILAWNGLLWLIRRRIHRWIVAGLAGMLCLVMAFRWEENWRGRHAWESYRREWESKGERFDWASFIPPPVADDQNFAMAPILAKSLASLWVTSTNQEPVNPQPKTGLLAMTLSLSSVTDVTNVIIGKWQTGTPTDLNAWQQYYRAGVESNAPPSYLGRRNGAPGTFVTNEFPTRAQAQTPAEDVLLALSKYDLPLAELAEAARRPLARFPIQYQTENPQQIRLPHLMTLKQCALVLQLRAIAELAAGRSQAALPDVKLILRMSEAIRSEPFYVSTSVRLSLLNLAIQPIWEGIHDHRWTEAELTELGQTLRSMDLVSEWNGIMRRERAFDIATVDHWRCHRDEAAFEVDATFYMYQALSKHIPDVPEGLRNSLDCLPMLPAPLSRLWDDSEDSEKKTMLVSWLAHLPPDGWYELNKVELGVAYQSMALTLAEPAKHRLSRSVTLQTGLVFLASPEHHWERFPGSCLCAILFPMESSVFPPFASTQNAIDMARVACALEIYRLHQNTCPAALDALTPEFIPTLPPDVINGEPLHYRRLDGEHYRLYSVGWNGRDDGGIVGRNTWGFYDPKAGDWVWEN